MARRPPVPPPDDDEPATQVYDPTGTRGPVNIATPAPLPPSPMRAVSMKTPKQLEDDKRALAAARPEIPKVNIRPIADSSRANRSATPPHGLGTIAPPRDPKQARERQVWSLVFWGSIVVIIASLVALVVWLIAR